VSIAEVKDEFVSWCQTFLRVKKGVQLTPRLHCIGGDALPRKKLLEILGEQEVPSLALRIGHNPVVAVLCLALGEAGSQGFDMVFLWRDILPREVEVAEPDGR